MHLVEPRGAQYAVACGPVAPPASRSVLQTSPGVWRCWLAASERPPPTARSAENKDSHDLTALIGKQVFVSAQEGRVEPLKLSSYFRITATPVTT